MYFHHPMKTTTNVQTVHRYSVPARVRPDSQVAKASPNSGRMLGPRGLLPRGFGDTEGWAERRKVHCRQRCGNITHHPASSRSVRHACCAPLWTLVHCWGPWKWRRARNRDTEPGSLPRSSLGRMGSRASRQGPGTTGNDNDCRVLPFSPGGTRGSLLFRRRFS